MKFCIVSDIHSNLEALNTVLKDIETEKPDIKVCLGDIVGYGPNPDECTEKVFSNFDIIIAGNHDQAVTGDYSTETFNPLARMAVEWTQANIKKKNISRLQTLKLREIKEDTTFVHATPTAPEKFGYILSLREAKKNFPTLTTLKCFIGHSHIPIIYNKKKNGIVREIFKESVRITKEEKYIINVGSVGQPRDRSPLASYGIYDSELNSFKIRRLSYDIKTVQDKMKKADLPSYLITRLAKGM